MQSTYFQDICTVIGRFTRVCKVLTSTVFPPPTNKPAVVTLLHHVNNVPLPQLQFVLVARRVVVQRLVPVVQKTAVN